MNGQRVEIPGSEPPHRAEAHSLRAADPNREITVTVMLRRESPEQTCASPQDLEAIRRFAQQYGLTVVDEKPEARTVHLRGSVAQMDAAFGTQLREFQDAQGHRYLSYDGPLSVPQSLAPVVMAVLGLDQRPIARQGRSAT
jgi:kumamolisin